MNILEWFKMQCRGIWNGNVKLNIKRDGAKHNLYVKASGGTY